MAPFFVPVRSVGDLEVIVVSFVEEGETCFDHGDFDLLGDVSFAVFYSVSLGSFASDSFLNGFICSVVLFSLP